MGWLDWLNIALMVIAVVAGVIEQVTSKPDDRFDDDDRLNFRS